jgi:hypothetical protein
MSDLFDEIAGATPDEGPTYEDLPAKAWCLGRTADKDSGGAAPTVKTVGKNDLRQFNLALICQGGDGLINKDKHEGKFCFFSAFIHPGDREPDHMIISGRFAGFLNVVFSPGVGEGESAEVRKDMRWKNTWQQLWAVAQERGIKIDQYEGDKARFIAGCAVTALTNESKQLLFKTNARKWKDGSGNVSIEVGATEDYTPGNITNRKVASFDDAVVPSSTGTF